VARWPDDLYSRPIVRKIVKRKRGGWISCSIYLPKSWVGDAEKVQYEFHDDYVILRLVREKDEKAGP